MRVFVLSFGTIELLDGILVIDTDLSYKTFETEYKEILDKADKSIKKLLKAAFDLEVTIKDSKTEGKLLHLLEQLEAYDKPTFNFPSPFKPAGIKESVSNRIEPEIEDFVDLDGPDLLEEPEILDIELRANEPDSFELPIEAEPSLDVNVEPIQESQSSVGYEEASEELNVSEPPSKEKGTLKITETPASDIETKLKAITSNFLVQLEENATFNISRDAEIKSAEVEGKLILKNFGETDRIWDINLILDKETVQSTSLKENTFYIKELRPGEEWEQSYNIKKPKGLPIKFKESIDTYPKNSEEIHTLIPDQETLVEITFFIENVNDHTLSNLTIEKKFPEEFRDLKVIDEIPPHTTIKFENNVIAWKIPKLKAKERIEFQLQAKISTKTSVQTGPVKLNFTLHGDLYSNLAIETLSSITKNMYYIEKDEDETKPDHWTCRFIFENKSEFPLLLETAEIYSGNMNSEQKDVILHATKEIVRGKNEKWRSKEWTATSKEIPTFGKMVKFAIIPVTTKSLNVEMEVDEITLPILSAAVKKSYSLTEVASYIDTPVELKITILNRGDAEITELYLTDFIPENFSPPKLKDIEVFIDGKKIDKGKQKIDLNLTQEPESDASSEPHQLHIQLLNLQESIGGLKPDSKLELKYQIKAIQPPPGKLYSFPLKVNLSTASGGPPLEINPSMVENSEIKVTHKRRKLTVGKSVFPGSATDEYEILMVFQNRGNTSLENATISDLIPSNFNLISSEPEASLKELGENSLIEWKFNIIEPGTELELTYTVKGTGEYKSGDAEIFF